MGTDKPYVASLFIQEEAIFVNSYANTTKRAKNSLYCLFVQAKLCSAVNHYDQYQIDQVEGWKSWRTVQIHAWLYMNATPTKDVKTQQETVGYSDTPYF